MLFRSTDLTSGQSSDSEGRYVDLEPLHHGRFQLDFNYAYNPYCAYNPNWNCPVPPVENRLDVAIEAGEKSFPDAECHSSPGIASARIRSTGRVGRRVSPG